MKFRTIILCNVTKKKKKKKKKKGKKNIKKKKKKKMGEKILKIAVIGMMTSQFQFL